MDVDVEVDLGHATLRHFMRTAFMPTAVMDTRVTNMGQPQASPLRQFARAFSSELPSQHDLFAGFIGADDMWANFAVATFVAADHLLLAEDGVANECVCGASLGHQAPNRAAGVGWILLSPQPRASIMQRRSDGYSAASLAPPLAFRGFPASLTATSTSGA